MSFALKIRDFLDDLFYSKLVLQLENDLVRLRQDMEERLHDKDLTVSELRSEKAALQSKAALYELTLMPHASRQGADLVRSTKPTKPNFAEFFKEPPVMSRWQVLQQEHDKKIAEEIAADEQAKKSQTA